MDYSPLRDFLIALFIGALVGMEREKRKSLDATGGRGIRTFILIAELGAISAWLSLKLNFPWIFVIALAIVAALIMMGYALQKREGGNYGLTTEVATLIVFSLGGLTLFGYSEIAVALAIATTVVLVYKEPLHGLVARFGADDIYAIVKLLGASFIILPLLPDRAIDPLGALNPYRLWLMVILISGLSLVGYVAVRWLGPGRGDAVTGLTGGLVSSTVVTLSFAKNSKEHSGKGRGAGLATGVLLAWTVMFVRVVIEVAIVHPPLVREILIPFAAMTAAGVLASIVIYFGDSGQKKDVSKEEVALKNPFSLVSAIRFALFFSLILVLVKLAQRYFPGSGMYGVAALAGTTDVDAITLSMAQFARDGGSSFIATTSIAIAALANTAVKAGIIAVLAVGGMRTKVLVGTAFIFIAGAVSLFYSMK